MQKNRCNLCSKSFSDRSNCLRHQKKCKGVIVKNNSLSCQYCSKCYSTKYNRSYHEKICTSRIFIEAAEKHHVEMKDIVKKQKPNTTNITNNINNINNIIHIENLNITKDTDFYQELKKKMGEKPAIDFIARSAIEGNSMRIFEKLYLDDKDAEDYPIACRDNHEFRFKDKDVLTSKKAREMSDMINEKVVNCIINVSIYIIDQSLKGNEDIKENMFEGIYNLNKIQGAAQKLNMKKQIFFNKLAKKIKVKDHPFFLRSIDEKSS